MSLAQSSLDAWLCLQRENRIGANQQIVLDVFRIKVRGQPLSNFDLSVILGWPVNRITPRVNELRKLGRLVLVGFKRQLETGHRVQLWGLPEDNMIWVDFDYLKGSDRQ